MKSKPLIRIPGGLLLAGTALLFCSDAFAQRAGQSMSVQTGVVVASRSVDLQSEAGRGALVGGVAGYHRDFDWYIDQARSHGMG